MGHRLTTAFRAVCFPLRGREEVRRRCRNRRCHRPNSAQRNSVYIERRKRIRRVILDPETVQIRHAADLKARQRKINLTPAIGRKRRQSNPCLRNTVPGRLDDQRLSASRAAVDPEADHCPRLGLERGMVQINGLPRALRRFD